MTREDPIAAMRYGVAAGAAGGIAEIIWITTYAAATGENAASLARGVTTAAGVDALLPVASMAVGIVIHMALSVTLGIALAFGWKRLSTYGARSTGPYPLVLATLAVVWTTNFFIILPLVSPGFVHLVPYSVSLLSKLLFGLATAAVLRHHSADLIATQAI